MELCEIFHLFTVKELFGGFYTRRKKKSAPKQKRKKKSMKKIVVIGDIVQHAARVTCHAFI